LFWRSLREHEIKRPAKQGQKEGDGGGKKEWAAKGFADCGNLINSQGKGTAVKTSLAIGRVFDVGGSSLVR